MAGGRYVKAGIRSGELAAATGLQGGAAPALCEPGLSGPRRGRACIAGKHSGAVARPADRLAEDAPSRGLLAKLGGAPNRQILFFRHPFECLGRRLYAIEHIDALARE